MSSIENTKVFASVLVAGITFMVAGIIGDALVHPKRLAEPAIRIATPEATTQVAAAPAGPEPIAPLMAAANAENGATLFRRQCAACHTVDQGGRNGVGPNLWAVLGGPHAHAAGFQYSAVIAGMRDRPWDYEALNKFIANPRAYAAGTRMAFAGVASATQRADIIAYLRTLDTNPRPLPTAEEIAAATRPAAPAAAAPAPAAGATPAAATEGPSLGARLAAADPAAGQVVFNRVCAVCHTANEGGPARVGPNLWNIMGREHSSVPGFNYSAAMRAFSGPWTYEEMYAWLASPAQFAPGNRMGIGVPDAKQRADVIAYLRSLSNDPKPFPAP